MRLGPLDRRLERSRCLSCAKSHLKVSRPHVLASDIQLSIYSVLAAHHAPVAPSVSRIVFILRRRREV
jgi:hypothetical protein